MMNWVFWFCLLFSMIISHFLIYDGFFPQIVESYRGFNF